jgi:predicted PurR-regulated permease PerM
LPPFDEFDAESIHVFHVCHASHRKQGFVPAWTRHFTATLERVKELPRRDRIDNPFRESARVLGIYVKAQVIIVCIVTVLYAVGFASARMPFWYVVAVIAGACTIIPRIGALIGLALAAIVAYFGDLSLTQFLIVFGTWVVVQAVEGFYLTPKLLGRPLGLRPLLVFMALLLGSFFFGPIGFLLAVPALAVAAVFWRYFREEREIR